MKSTPIEIPATVTVRVSMIFELRGGCKTVIAPSIDQKIQPRYDNAVLKAIARAYYWRRLIENKQYASITELAKGEGLNQTYACRVLRLTLLSPEIVETILDGRQQAGVSLKQLLKPFSQNWNEQRSALRIVRDA
jgi:hypothetical protein